ncbi:Uncharacterized HTH-type transcriptional regulator yvdT [Fusobacterium necrogenes]|uniref:Uncharacterized HTH-type transcriptional regulator yvdT n=1 Tax=Fusobacterium necrogenes TaxID=858 RepID=A0A377GYA0_9FUSO|nr:TetR/AcrR family transcriptional regulator [Fusobacterium necrogenes]STO31732.1 Uncharacterized HTH-type transcriptional regulator yvdT [Fusobacterium necrogenes]
MGKRELIIYSMKKLILEKGYNNVTVEDITNDAGIAKGSFYTYFKNKSSVVDCILEEIIKKLNKRNFLDKRLSLTNSIKKIVLSRLKLEDDDLKDNLFLLNLFRNGGILESKTIDLLKIIDKIFLDALERLILFYSESVKLKREEARVYSKIINNIIFSYKVFTLFFSEKDNRYIVDINNIKNKYQSKEFEKNVEAISESILKILIY